MNHGGTGPHVLVVEDEEQMRRFLRVTLRVNDYRVTEATTAAEALAMAQEQRPDVVVLDLGLPDGDGMQVVVGLRSWFRGPLLVVSARHQESDKVQALDAGADDYLTKPFGTSELLARLRVAQRHFAREASAAGNSDRGLFVAGELKVDRDRHVVTVRGEAVKLTPIEYKLLVTLVRNAGKVVTRRQLLREVWGEQHLDESHYVRVYMSNLRRKLEVDPARPQLLLTEQNIGYRLQVDA